VVPVRRWFRGDRLIGDKGGREGGREGMLTYLEIGIRFLTTLNFIITSR